MDKFDELIRIVLDDLAAHEKYGDSIKVIFKMKGKLFFEETSEYHKAAKWGTHRLMLKFDYGIEQKLLQIGVSSRDCHIY